MENNSSITSLPHELLVDVLTKVASSSFTDLFNSKLCCKEFRGAAEEEDILEQVSIEKIPMIHQWLRNHELDWFMNRCMARGNPEALYRQGMVEYFSHLRTQSGLENLRKASEKRHVEATYVYAVLLLCMGGQSAVEGSNLLNAMEEISTTRSKSSGTKLFEKCRERIQYIFKWMWIKNRVVDRRTDSCRHRKNVVRVITMWEGRREEEEEEEEEGESCEFCRWDREIRFFCNLLE